MILDELTLHNFGTYAGRQTAKLRPTSRTTPVVVIGGLNGRGKTTFLDALQLALYGKRARCSNRGTLAYDDFLRRSIHNRSMPEEGASVELRFLHNEEGRVHTYEVRRSWFVSGNSVRERVQVSKDEHVDKLLSEHWDEHVEHFIPLGLSSLFFFDGEKVAELASPERGQAILRTAVSSLLGIDLVDRLESDLLVLERRKAAQLLPEAEKRELEELELELERLGLRKTDLEQRRAGMQNDVDRTERAVLQAEQQFLAEGGEFFRDRSKFEVERRQLEAELERVNDSLREEAAGVLPLLLVRDLLQDVRVQAAREEEAAENEATAELLATRDEQILSAFLKVAGKEPAKQLSGLLKTDRANRKAVEVDRYLNLSADAIDQLHRLLGGELDYAASRASDLTVQVSKLEAKLGDVQKVLASVPDESKLQNLTEALDAARKAHAEQKIRFEHLETELTIVSREIDFKAQRRTALARSAAEAQLERVDDHRILTYATKVRDTLATFRQRVLEKHVARIQHLVLDSFRQLIRKRELLTDIRIDPNTLALTLIGSDGAEIEPERLSAGERQILAIALLWGLGRASGRPLPTIVDTPLGRLDGTIRENIVRNYFPNASHQVVLLSTDTELDEDAIETISRSVSRTYHLAFDDATGATSIQEGYFWEDNEDVA